MIKSELEINLSLKINKVQNMRLVSVCRSRCERAGAEISFELLWKEMVLNEHRTLTDPPHHESWTSENVQY